MTFEGGDLALEAERRAADSTFAPGVPLRDTEHAAPRVWFGYSTLEHTGGHRELQLVIRKPLLRDHFERFPCTWKSHQMSCAGRAGYGNLFQPAHRIK